MVRFIPIHRSFMALDPTWVQDTQRTQWHVPAEWCDEAGFHHHHHSVAICFTMIYHMSLIDICRTYWYKCWYIYIYLYTIDSHSTYYTMPLPYYWFIHRRHIMRCIKQNNIPYHQQLDLGCLKTPFIKRTAIVRVYANWYVIQLHLWTIWWYDGDWYIYIYIYLYI